MTRRDDGKTRALAVSRTLNPRPEKVTDAAFAPGSFFDPADLVQVKYEMVRRSEIDGLDGRVGRRGGGTARARRHRRNGPAGGGSGFPSAFPDWSSLLSVHSQSRAVVFLTSPSCSMRG